MTKNRFNHRRWKFDSLSQSSD